jgi:NAD+ synthase (glutamine-hydrolysing)
MTHPLRIALAQINPTVGDLNRNRDLILARLLAAREWGAQVMVFPELAVCGYPPRDLLLKPAFLRRAQACVEEIAAASTGVVVVVGGVEVSKALYNAAFVCTAGRVVAVQRKTWLPNYDVFDERRYFHAAGSGDNQVFDIGGIGLGVSICEDIWEDAGPLAEQAAAGIRLHVNISASPYHAGKGWVRQELICRRARVHRTYVAFCNQVGGQDDLVFDGGSVVAGPEGELLATGAIFAEDLLVIDLPLAAIARRTPPADVPRLPVRSLALPAAVDRHPPPSPAVVLRPDGEEPAEIYRALLLGLRDYFRKNGFASVLVALSGGIDSALVATLAADALGPDKVTGVLMPSRISSAGSVTDAEALVANLGIHSHTLPIAGLVDVAQETLAPAFAGRPADVTEENIQSRARGLLLMALSNKLGALVLATGNKSEMAVGYATLYGDMCGGLAVIADVPKTLVYRLCEWRNQQSRGAVIPAAILTKPPSAELRPHQQDTDSLPDYAILDPILDAYVEEQRPLEEIVAQGFDEPTVRAVVRLVDRAEYKRQQAAPGIRITPKAFGTGRRMPITNGFTDEWG